MFFWQLSLRGLCHICQSYCLAGLPLTVHPSLEKLLHLSHKGFMEHIMQFFWCPKTHYIPLLPIKKVHQLEIKSLSKPMKSVQLPSNLRFCTRKYRYTFCDLNGSGTEANLMRSSPSFLIRWNSIYIVNRFLASVFRLPLYSHLNKLHKRK